MSATSVSRHATFAQCKSPSDAEPGRSSVASPDAQPAFLSPTELANFKPNPKVCCGLHEHPPASLSYREAV
jgi:hypothetical protein